MRLSLSSLYLSAVRRRSGVDCAGDAVALGDLDVDGIPVGWFDRERLGWASHRERCGCFAAARYDEALTAALRQDGADMPRRWPFILRWSPLYPRYAAQEIALAESFRRSLETARLMRARDELLEELWAKD